MCGVATATTPTSTASLVEMDGGASIRTTHSSVRYTFGVVRRSCQSGAWKTAMGEGNLNSGEPGSVCTVSTYCNRSSGRLNAMVRNCSGLFVGSPFEIPVNVSWNGSNYVGSNAAYQNPNNGVWVPAGSVYNCTVASASTWIN